MATTKRTQIARTPVLKSNDEIGDSLATLCEVTTRIRNREAILNEEISRLRAQAEEELREDQELSERLKHDIEEYCTYHRDTIFPKDRKSLTFPHGEVNFRIHPPAVQVLKGKRWTINTVIDAIRNRWADSSNYLREKVELNKETLALVDPTELNSVGLEIIQKETFGIVLNLDELAGSETSTRNTKVGKVA